MDLLATASEQLDWIHRNMQALHKEFLEGRDWDANAGKEENWPFLYDSGMQGIWKMDSETAGNMERWYFVGDIHGDFFALFNLVKEIFDREENWRICLLGDIMDRGMHSLECFIFILMLADSYGERIIWIAGNHDVGLSFNPDTRQFDSEVSPSEFQEFLNKEDCMRSYRQSWGELFIQLSERLPRAVLFPNGLLATHGGIPHDDIQNEIEGLSTVEGKWERLKQADCLQDFTWTRIHRNPKKRPNRNSKGCEFGFLNFQRFCEVTKECFPVTCMINGHEHPRAGFDLQEKYKVNPALTLRGFGFDTLLSGFDAYQRYLPELYMGRGQPEGLPELVIVPYNESELSDFYPDTKEHFVRIFPELASPEEPPILDKPADEVNQETTFKTEESQQEGIPEVVIVPYNESEKSDFYPELASPEQPPILDKPADEVNQETTFKTEEI